MSQEFPLIKEIVIVTPPTHYDVLYKKPKFDKDGKQIKHLRYYLPGNLFYSDAGSIHTVRKIIYETKEFLFSKMKGIPEMDKIRLEFEYHKMQDIDLDNKASFWVKVFLDILKTPSVRQVQNGIRYKRPIISTETIQDDNTKCIDNINLKFVRGEHKMVFRIYGRVKSEQKELDLFFK